jgi:hypothetical protein
MSFALAANGVIERWPFLAGPAIGGLEAIAVVGARWEVQAAFIVAPLVVLTALWTLNEPLRWWTGFVVTALLLPPLPLEFGNAGPHIGLGFAALGLWVGAAQLGHWRVRLDGVAIALLAFTGWLFATAMFAAVYSGPEVAAASLARVGLFAIGVFVYFYVIDGPGRFTLMGEFAWARLGFFLAAASALWACVEFFAQLEPSGRFAPQYVWLPFGVYRRAQGVFHEAGMLGNLCAMFLVMAAVAASRSEVRKQIASGLPMFLGVAVLLAALAVSFSRSPVAGLLAALITLIALERGRMEAWRPLMFVAALLAGLAVLAVYSIPALAEAYWLRFSDTIVYAGDAAGAVLSGRLETWAYLLDRLADHPSVLLTGIGFKTLPYTPYFSEPVTADNMYLSLLAETGLPGLLLMGVLTIAMLRSAVEARRSGSRAAWFYGTWFVCFWVSELVQMLSVDVLTYWRVLPLAFFTLALARREAMAREAAAER